MSQLRTPYRFVSLMLAAALLFGPAVPLVRAACAMDDGEMRDSDGAMHDSATASGSTERHGVHDHAAMTPRDQHAMHPEMHGAATRPGETTPSEKKPCGMHEQPQDAERRSAADADLLGCDELKSSYQVCCRSTDSAPSAVFSSLSQRIAGLLGMAVQVRNMAVPARPHGVTSEPSTSPPGITSTIRHQALLATFLI